MSDCGFYSCLGLFFTVPHFQLLLITPFLGKSALTANRFFPVRSVSGSLFTISLVHGITSSGLMCCPCKAFPINFLAKTIHKLQQSNTSTGFISQFWVQFWTHSPCAAYQDYSTQLYVLKKEKKTRRKHYARREMDSHASHLGPWWCHEPTAVLHLNTMMSCVVIAAEAHKVNPRDCVPVAAGTFEGWYSAGEIPPSP